jgi:hypothetical protein
VTDSSATHAPGTRGARGKGAGGGPGQAPRAVGGGRGGGSGVTDGGAARALLPGRDLAPREKANPAAHTEDTASACRYFQVGLYVM